VFANRRIDSSLVTSRQDPDILTDDDRGKTLRSSSAADSHLSSFLPYSAKSTSSQLSRKERTETMICVKPKDPVANNLATVHPRDRESVDPVTRTVFSGISREQGKMGTKKNNARVLIQSQRSTSSRAIHKKPVCYFRRWALMTK